jgi:hypothetical protein
VPEVIDPRWSHEDALELTEAVHEQALPAVRAMALVPPRDCMVLLVGLIE